MLTFYRDAAFEIEAKYSNPEIVVDKESLISKFVVRAVWCLSIVFTPRSG
jgi:hypothetical protein